MKGEVGMSTLEEIYGLVLAGKRNEIEASVKKALGEGVCTKLWA
jgi:hypothetical protein